MKCGGIVGDPLSVNCGSIGECHVTCSRDASSGDSGFHIVPEPLEFETVVALLKNSGAILQYRAATGRHAKVVCGTIDSERAGIG